MDASTLGVITIYICTYIDLLSSQINCEITKANHNSLNTMLVCLLNNDLINIDISTKQSVYTNNSM